MQEQTISIRFSFEFMVQKLVQLLRRTNLQNFEVISATLSHFLLISIENRTFACHFELKRVGLRNN